MTLQEYKEQEGNEVYSNFDSSKKQAVDYFIQGFDKVLELDLPIKFIEWITKERYKKVDVYEKQLNTNYCYQKWSNTKDFILLTDEDTGFFTKELYDYWLQNIYKL